MGEITCFFFLNQQLTHSVKCFSMGVMHIVSIAPPRDCTMEGRERGRERKRRKVGGKDKEEQNQSCRGTRRLGGLV